jgi:hypothetical protein
MKTPSPAAQAVELVREQLRRHKGKWPQIVAHVKRKNPKTKITYRWIVGFDNREQVVIDFYRVIELGEALGVDIRVAVLPGRNYLDVETPIGRQQQRSMESVEGGGR